MRDAMLSHRDVAHFVRSDVMFGATRQRRASRTAGLHHARSVHHLPERANIVEKTTGRNLSFFSGVGDGTRTHNAWNHNPVLCQLNYTHHIYFSVNPCYQLEMARQEGLEPPTYCLEGSCSIQLSYWRISMERVTGIGPAYPAWKAGVLPLNYTRRPCALIQP